MMGSQVFRCVAVSLGGETVVVRQWCYHACRGNLGQVRKNGNGSVAFKP